MTASESIERFYYCLTGYGVRYIGGYRSEPELMNKKKLAKHDIFTSESMFELYSELGDDESYFSAGVQEQSELLRRQGGDQLDFELPDFPQFGKMAIYRREYGCVLVGEDEPAPPRGLLYEPEDE